jgi:hypothetical protein
MVSKLLLIPKGPVMSQNTGSRMIKESDGHFEGIIVASRWDIDGNITGVSLHTKLEEEFIIKMNDIGKLLIPFCQSKAAIKGVLIETGFLTPLSFEII